MKELRENATTIAAQALTIKTLKRDLQEERAEVERQTARAEGAEAQVARLQKVLRAAARERHSLVANLNARLEELTEAYNVQSTRRIQELAQVITLRERQFAAASHSPRGKGLERVRSLPSLVKKRSLDAKPMDLGVARDSAAEGALNHAHLLERAAAKTEIESRLMVLPKFAEAEELAQNVIAADEVERQKILQIVRDKAEAYQIDEEKSPREFPAPAWQSPYKLGKEISSPTKLSQSPSPTKLSPLKHSKPF